MSESVDHVSDVASTVTVNYNPSRPQPLTGARQDATKLRTNSLILRRSAFNVDITAADALRIRTPPPPPSPIRFPVTFRSADAFLRFKWKIYATFSIHFQVIIEAFSSGFRSQRRERQDKKLALMRRSVNIVTALLHG